MGLSEYVDLFSNLGALGAIVLLFWRMTNHTLPRMAKDFKDGVDKSWQHCQETIKDQRKDFKDMLTQQREDFKISLQQHKLVCQQDLDRIRQSVENNGK